MYKRFAHASLRVCMFAKGKDAPLQRKFVKLSSTERLIQSALWVRARYLLPTHRAQPDFVAKREVISHAIEGREHPALLAYNNNSLGFGFSAGGLLFPYFIGVVNRLHQLRIIQPGAQLAGASAGSLISGCYNAGLEPSVILTLFYELIDDLRKGGTYRRLGPCLQKLLERHLPDDAHERCSGNTHVAVSTALPYARGLLISEYESKDDLIQTLLTSCHIPFYFTGTLARTFRGRLCYDGGLTNFIPTPPTSYAARVCCFPSQGMPSKSNIHISPDSFDEDWSTNVTTMVQWALQPADDEVLMRLTEQGERDAAAWANLTGVLHAALPDPDDWYRHAFVRDLSLTDEARALTRDAKTAAAVAPALGVPTTRQLEAEQQGIVGEEQLDLQQAKEVLEQAREKAQP